MLRSSKVEAYCSPLELGFMDTISHANTVYLKNFDTEIKKIVDDLTLIKEEKFHHEEHMAIL